MRPSFRPGDTNTAAGAAGIAVGIAIVLALAEFTDAFFIDYPAAAVVVAVLFVAGALWARREGIGGLVLIAVLLAVEIAFLPTYSRSGVGDWITQILVGVVSAVGLVAAVAAIRERRSHRNLVEAAPPTADAAS
jgi:hypothetical protein